MYIVEKVVEMVRKKLRINTNIMCLQRVNTNLCKGKSYLNNLCVLWSDLPKHVSYEIPFDTNYTDFLKAFGKIPSARSLKCTRYSLDVQGKAQIKNKLKGSNHAGEAENGELSCWGRDSSGTPWWVLLQSGMSMLCGYLWPSLIK